MREKLLTILEYRIFKDFQIEEARPKTQKQKSKD